MTKPPFSRTHSRAGCRAPRLAGRVPRPDHRGHDSGEQPRHVGRHLRPAGARRLARLDADRLRLPLLPLHRRRLHHPRPQPPRRERGQQARPLHQDRPAHGAHLRAGPRAVGLPVLRPLDAAHPRRPATHRRLLFLRRPHLPQDELAHAGGDYSRAARRLLDADDAGRGARLRRRGLEHGGEPRLLRR